MGRRNLRGDDKRRGGSKGKRSDRSFSSSSYGNRSYGGGGGRSSYGGGRSSYGGGGGGGGFNRPPREMHKAVCAECGKECEVPFKPTEGRPVYCRECFQKKRGPRY